MMRPVSLDQRADRLAVGKVQAQPLDLVPRAAEPSPLLATMGGADDSIALRGQQFREIGTVLAEHPGDQGRLRIALTHAAAPKYSSGCGADRRFRLCANAQTGTHRQAPGSSRAPRAGAPPIRGTNSNAPAAWGGSKAGI